MKTFAILVSIWFCCLSAAGDLSIYTPPPQFATNLGKYRSPLLFKDGTQVRTKADWQRRREEIKHEWHSIMGAWPELIEKPQYQLISSEKRENFLQQRIRLQVSKSQWLEGYLLLPGQTGKLPAVLVPYYEPQTSLGLNKAKLRDFAYQLTKRGFVTLSIGSPGGDARLPNLSGATSQPLSYLGYIAANSCNLLASLPQVNPEKIGVVGHSYGGKWAMFGSCLYDRFACAAWSDPGIVFDEARSNVNYWDPWYLGWEKDRDRKLGLPSESHPRTGAYKTLVEGGHDLHELHALMAPRPFLVSGGSEDQPERWIPLNHARAVNDLLEFKNRVAMTNRLAHDPTEESNEAIYRFFEEHLKPAK